jgi:formamidopyrimidine-DNA glycosylase
MPLNWRNFTLPELPEVETTRLGIEPLVTGRALESIKVRNAALRWPVEIPPDLRGQTLAGVTRRAKYLLAHFETGVLLIHLGMSGNLRVVSSTQPYLKHDHVELTFAGDRALRLNDPRRFGSVLWSETNADGHWLLDRLGPEPLDDEFDGDYLKRQARHRRVAVKTLLMDSHIVVGVGDIYANEALFLAGVRPGVRASRVTLAAYQRIALAIKGVLQRAIEMGGTTLRDFVKQDGNPGYFKQSLNVYGREGLPCRVCGAPLTGTRLANRATVYCKNCQKTQGFAQQPVLKS